MSTITDLSDAILSEIFSYIGLVERQRLEIVCKRWRKLIQVLWSKTTKLSFEIMLDDEINFALSSRSASEPGYEAATISEIGAMLKICENNLTELNIFDRCPDGDETDEFTPLRNCKNLRKFHVYTYDNNLVRDILKYLPTGSLEKLGVYKIQHAFTEEIDEIIVGILMQAEHLTSLGLAGVSLKALDIIGKKSELKSLRLDNLNESIESEDLSLDFTKLINLEELIIFEERMVDDRLLIQVAENCKKLRRVEFWTENLISAGLRTLETLPNLRTVNVRIPKAIEILNYFSNLEEFRCDLNNHDLINEESLTEFLKRSPNLKEYSFNNHGYQVLFEGIAKKLGKEIRCVRY